MNVASAYKTLKLRQGSNLYDVGKAYRKLVLNSIERDDHAWSMNIREAFNVLRHPDTLKHNVFDYRPAAQRRSDKFLERRDIALYLKKLESLGKSDPLYKYDDRHIPEDRKEITIDEGGASKDDTVAIDTTKNPVAEESPSALLINNVFTCDIPQDDPLQIQRKVNESTTNISPVDLVSSDVAPKFTTDSSEEASNPVIKLKNDDFQNDFSIDNQVPKADMDIPSVSQRARWKIVLWAAVSLALAASSDVVKRQDVEKKVKDVFKMSLKEMHNVPQSECGRKGLMKFDRSGTWHITRLGFVKAAELFS